MNIEFEAPILGWRTLKDIYDYYLAQTPSEEGTSAAEVATHAAKRARLCEVAIQVETKLGTLSPERGAHARASIEELNDQAERMRAIAIHIMMRDAAAGVWFAAGRADGVGKHQFIHPSHWNFLLLNIEKGAVGRDNLRFEDLRCAFTKDVPENNPIHAAIRIALEDATTRRQVASTTMARLFDSPPLSPTHRHEIARTGAPGRPSSMHWVLEEFERRCGQPDVMLPTLAAEGKHLAAWFRNNHPFGPPLTARTIENKIRAQYGKVKRAPRHPTK